MGYGRISCKAKVSPGYIDPGSPLLGAARLPNKWILSPATTHTTRYNTRRSSGNSDSLVYQTDVNPMVLFVISSKVHIKYIQLLGYVPSHPDENTYVDR